jgi:hypothetical protein
VLALMTVLPQAHTLFPRAAVVAHKGVEHLLLLQAAFAIDASHVVNLLREIYCEVALATAATAKRAARGAPDPKLSRTGMARLRWARSAGAMVGSAPRHAAARGGPRGVDGGGGTDGHGNARGAASGAPRALASAAPSPPSDAPLERPSEPVALSPLDDDGARPRAPSDADSVVPAHRNALRTVLRDLLGFSSAAHEQRPLAKVREPAELLQLLETSLAHASRRRTWTVRAALGCACAVIVCMFALLVVGAQPLVGTGASTTLGGVGCTVIFASFRPATRVVATGEAAVAVVFGVIMFGLLSSYLRTGVDQMVRNPDNWWVVAGTVALRPPLLGIGATLSYALLLILIASALASTGRGVAALAWHARRRSRNARAARELDPPRALGPAALRRTLLTCIGSLLALQLCRLCWQLAVINTLWPAAERRAAATTRVLALLAAVNVACVAFCASARIERRVCAALHACVREPGAQGALTSLAPLLGFGGEGAPPEAAVLIDEAAAVFRVVALDASAGARACAAGCALAAPARRRGARLRARAAGARLGRAARRAARGVAPRPAAFRDGVADAVGRTARCASLGRRRRRWRRRRRPRRRADERGGGERGRRERGAGPRVLQAPRLAPGAPARRARRARRRVCRARARGRRDRDRALRVGRGLRGQGGAAADGVGARAVRGHLAHAQRGARPAALLPRALERLLLLASPKTPLSLNAVVACHVWRALGGQTSEVDVVLVGGAATSEQTVAAFDTFHVMHALADDDDEGSERERATIAERLRACVRLATVRTINLAVRDLLPVVHRALDARVA